LGGTVKKIVGIPSYSIEYYAMTRLNLEGDEFHGCYSNLTRGWECLGDNGSEKSPFINTSNVTELKSKDVSSAKGQENNKKRSNNKTLRPHAPLESSSTLPHIYYKYCKTLIYA